MQFSKRLFSRYCIILLFTSILTGCISSNSQYEYQKSPVDILIRDLSNVNSFSIILHDMDYDERNDIFKHCYNVIIESPDTILSKKTDWVAVSQSFFDANKDNMGMEIASKKDGKVSKVAAPAGYSNYVGNEKYGQWVQRDGGSFWEFYGKYAFMSSMFRMAMFPVRYSYWNDYNRNYYNYGKPYYGSTSNGQRMYGTNSSYSKANGSSAWNSKPSSFKDRVRQKVSRSTSSTNKSIYSRRNRTSSRYSRSSTRSRGGGFGK